MDINRMKVTVTAIAFLFAHFWRDISWLFVHSPKPDTARTWPRLNQDPETEPKQVLGTWLLAPSPLFAGVCAIITTVESQHDWEVCVTALSLHCHIHYFGDWSTAELFLYSFHNSLPWSYRMSDTEGRASGVSATLCPVARGGGRWELG